MRSFIYIVTAPAVGATKIGMSIDPAARVSDLQASSPTRLDLVATVEGERDEVRKVERLLHGVFAAERLHNEWFALDQDALSEAVELANNLLVQNRSRTPVK